MKRQASAHMIFLINLSIERGCEDVKYRIRDSLLRGSLWGLSEWNWESIQNCNVLFCCSRTRGRFCHVITVFVLILLLSRFFLPQYCLDRISHVLNMFTHSKDDLVVPALGQVQVRTLNELRVDWKSNACVSRCMAVSHQIYMVKFTRVLYISGTSYNSANVELRANKTQIFRFF